MGLGQDHLGSVSQIQSSYKNCCLHQQELSHPVTMSISLFCFVTQFFVAVASLQLPPPTGPYNVGTKPYVLKHTTLNDPVAPKNISKSILVNVYYPTRDEAPPQRYLWPGLTDIYDAYYGLPNGTFNIITANLAYNAKPLTKKEHDKLRLPTLLFGPAQAGPPSRFYAGIILEMVSKGFPVVTVDHPWEPPYMEYPDGTVFTGHELAWSPCHSVSDTIHAYRLVDNSAILDALPHISIDLGIPLDLKRFAFFGHSLGASVALSQVLAERHRPASRDKVFLGALDMDGSLYGIGRTNSSWVNTRIPTLTLGSSRNYDLTWPVFESYQTSWTKSLRILGHSNHTDYSDLIFLKQANGIAGGAGVISAERFLEVSRTFVGAFFEMLVGKGEGALSGSADVTGKFPDVSFDYNNTGNPCEPAELCWPLEDPPPSC